jgi:uncharacterized membrane protein
MDDPNTLVPNEHRMVRVIFTWGISLSSAAMVSGLVLGWVTGDSALDSLDLGQVGDMSATAALMALGIGILAVTPIVNVGALTWLWVRHRRFNLAGVSLAVVFTLVLAMFVGNG